MKLFIKNDQVTKHYRMMIKNPPIPVGRITGIAKIQHYIGYSIYGYRRAVKMGVKVDPRNIDHTGLPSIVFSGYRANNPGCPIIGPFGEDADCSYWVFPSVPIRDAVYERLMEAMVEDISA